MNWRVKGLTQKLLGTLPGGVKVNDTLQRTVGGLRHFEATVSNKVHKDWVVLVAHMTELGVRPQGLRYVEIGTGWFPTLPVCFHLAGAAQVISYDVHRHLDARLTARMLQALESHLPAIATAAGRPLAEVRADYAALIASREPWACDSWCSVGCPQPITLEGKKLSAETADATPRPSTDRFMGTLPPDQIGGEASRLPFEYRAPADAAATGLPDASVDVVFSNSVLEHVSRETILRLLQESRRVLRSGGLTIHSANCGDHYAYFDTRITAINYLTYPADQWEFWNNQLLYQNRLRPQDFLDHAAAAGLEIVLHKHQPRPALLAALPSLPIAPEFRKYPAEQLCCTSIDFVARKP